MKGKQWMIWIITISIAICAIVFPGYRLDRRLNQSFEKVQLRKEMGAGEKICWLEDGEAYRLTSLMLYDKIDASEKSIKKMTGKEFLNKFPDSVSTYRACIEALIEQKMYPSIYSENESDLGYLIQEGSSDYELYQYKEKVLYNYEASVWKMNTELVEEAGTSVVYMDQSGNVLKAELYLNDSKKDLVLERLKFQKQQIETFFKSMEVEEFCVREELLPPEESTVTQRFLVELGSKKQKYFLDLTSQERLYRLELIAAVQ